MGSTTVIDTSRNLTNIGSITATDLVTENNVTKDGQGPYDWVTVGAGSRAAALRINDIAGANYIIRGGGYGLRFMKHVDSGSDSFVDVMRFNATSVSDTTADVAITNNLSVGGTISSGAITSSGSIQIGGSANLTWGGTYGAGKPTIAANTTTIYFYPTGNVSGQRLYLNATGLYNTGTLIRTNNRYNRYCRRWNKHNRTCFYSFRTTGTYYSDWWRSKLH